jgi:FkbM family methyltransferase
LLKSIQDYNNAGDKDQTIKTCGWLVGMRKLIRWMLKGFMYGAQSFLPGSQTRRIRARRQIALFFVRRFSTEMAFRRNGFLWTGTPFCLVAESIFLDDHYQDAYIERLRKWLKNERPVIVNVGAHIGDVALPLSRTGKRIIAIEPNPETFARLQRNVSQNNLGQEIICCQLAISDMVGEARLVIDPQTANCELMNESGETGHGPVESRGVLQVETTRLDDLLKSLGIAPDQVALVWSDTQGLESLVIESGSALWANGVPLWVEIWPKGLDCHGGTDRFVETCKRHFVRVLRKEHLDGEPESIKALESIVIGLKYGEYTDVLLIPRR